MREKLPPERRAEWDRAVGGDRWKHGTRLVSQRDIEDEKRISARKQKVTGRRVPAVASSVGLEPFREGIIMDFRRAVFLNFPTDLDHQMGAGDGVRWKNYLWKDESGKLIDNQCATGHHFSQIVLRGGLHDTWVGDVSGVADADGGSGLPAKDPKTQKLMDEHVLSKLDGGCCVFEVHSDGATELMHQSLERLAEKGGTYQFTLPFGGFKIHAKVYFGIRTLGRRVTAVLFGTRHPCMMYMKHAAYPIIASKIMASAVAGSPRTPEQTESLLDMTRGTLSNEEWVEYYAGKLEALEPEERRAYDRFLKQHDGDRHEAWQSLTGFKSWTGQTALKTVAGATEKVAVARQALSAARSRTERAARTQELEAAEAEHAAVVEARRRSRDGGEFPRRRSCFGGGR